MMENKVHGAAKAGLTPKLTKTLGPESAKVTEAIIDLLSKLITTKMHVGISRHRKVVLGKATSSSYKPLTVWPSC